MTHYLSAASFYLVRDVVFFYLLPPRHGHTVQHTSLTSEHFRTQKFAECFCECSLFERDGCIISLESGILDPRDMVGMTEVFRR